MNLKTNKSQNQKFIIATGGTGGHIFPARILAEELSLKGGKVKILSDKNYQRYKEFADNYDYHLIYSSKIIKSPIF